MEVNGRVMVVYICTSSSFGFLVLTASAPLFRFDSFHVSSSQLDFDFLMNFANA